MNDSPKPAAAPSLEGEYNIRARHPDHQTVRDGWATASARAKANLEWREDVRYGAEPRQTLDLFPARAAASPLLIFIHGGYWRSNEKTNYGFIAEPVIAHGGAQANINYGLTPDYSVGEIIAHARDAVIWHTAMKRREISTAGKSMSPAIPPVAISPPSSRQRTGRPRTSRRMSSRALPRSAACSIWPH